MRVLLVNGYAASNAHGRARYDEFRHYVTRVIKELERQDVTQIDMIEKPRHEIDEFLFEMHSVEFAAPSNITNFDRLDFVFVAGDPSACPWSPAMRKLALLCKMCMMTGKCLYGSGLGAGMLAFLCSTAGERLLVANNQGRGSAIDDIQAMPPPALPTATGTTTATAAIVGHSAAMGTEVLLDTRTGDFFTFDRRAHTYVPHGNTGLMQHSSDHAHDYGSRVNTARGGTKTHHGCELSHALCRSKRGDTKGCCRLEATNHPLFQALATREFLVNCKSTWDLDDRINATGNNKYRVLVDSSRGPMLIEFGNCVGSHFVLSKEYPESCTILRNFVRTKYESFKIHEHIDRSFISAISGSSRLKERLQLAQTKTSSAAVVKPHVPTRTHEDSSDNSQTIQRNLNFHTELPTRAATMTSGKTSPKRCRPVSAGPYRTVTKPPEAVRKIQTSRSMYPSSGIYPVNVVVGSPPPSASRDGAFDGDPPLKPGGNNNQQETRAAYPTRPQTARASLVSVGNAKTVEPEIDSPITVEDDPVPSMSPPRQQFPDPARARQQKAPTVKAHRRIRVAQQNELERPFCAIDKFNTLREIEKKQHKELYYSVVNDAPYRSEEERERLDQQKSKLKWVGGPFRSAVGKASTQLAPEAGVFARTPFVQKNTPFHIIQRRELEAPAPPSRHETRSPHKKEHGNSSTRRPASAAAATRRTQRCTLHQDLPKKS